MRPSDVTINREERDIVNLGEAGVLRLSSHSDALLTGHLDYDQSKSRCTFHGGGTGKQERKKSQCQHIGKTELTIKL